MNSKNFDLRCVVTVYRPAQTCMHCLKCCTESPHKAVDGQRNAKRRGWTHQKPTNNCDNFCVYFDWTNTLGSSLTSFFVFNALRALNTSKLDATSSDI